MKEKLALVISGFFFLAANQLFVSNDKNKTLQPFTIGIDKDFLKIFGLITKLHDKSLSQLEIHGSIYNYYR